MEMKYVLRMAGFVGVFILTFILYYNISIFYSHNPNLDIYANEQFIHKDRIAEQKQSPKIIIIGGSNAMYSISAEKIEEELGVPTVNYGVQTDLRDYLFERAKRVLNPGDIVILAMAYRYYWSEDKILFQPQHVRERYVLTYDKEYYRSLPLFEKLNFAVVNIFDLVNQIRYQERGVIEMHNITTLNEWGDETKNKYEEREESIIEKFPVGFPSEFLVRFPDYDGMRHIGEFSVWCNKNNITFFAAFPARLGYDGLNSSDIEEKLRLLELFFTRKGIVTLGSPVDYFYPIDHFYNTHYYLNDKGREISTGFIISKLLEAERIRNVANLTCSADKSEISV